ncbi:MAG: ABC transporter substrate-binding protein [Sphingorhabdus sp.]
MRAGWLSLLLLAGCNGQSDIAAGGIVSNNPCIDGVLAEIAAPGQIAAVSSYSHNANSASAPLDWARTMPAIGTSAEEIIAAKPRLLLTGNLASSGTNAALTKAGVRFVAVGVPVDVEDNKIQIRAVASAIGRQAAGERLITQIDDTLAHNDSDAPISAIIWQNGGFVAGAGTLQDALLAAHGFANASATYGLKSWDILPLETLIRKPPQVIFMPTSANGDDARALAARRQLLKHLGGKTRVVNFPDKLLFCGGPTVIKVSGILSQTREAMQ